MDGNTLEWGEAGLAVSVEDGLSLCGGRLDATVRATDPAERSRNVDRRIRVSLTYRLEAGRVRHRSRAAGPPVPVPDPPSGDATVDEGEAATPHDGPARVRADGFGRPGRFVGEVRVADGVLRLEGALDGVPLRLRVAFDESAFRVEDHPFGSFEEASAFAPERIRHLRVPRLDDRVLGFANLVELELVPSPPEAGIGDVPASLDALGALRTLVVRGRPPGRPGARTVSAVDEPPAVPGLDALLARAPQLASLSDLTVLRCRVPALPDALAEMPPRGLTLTGCALERVPAALMRSPRLEWLWLGGNRLRTLPELDERSGLVRIGLEDNPFESLPASLARLWPAVHIEREKKALFMDARFDARGPHPVDRAPLLASSAPALARELTEALDASPALAGARDAILSLARRSVFLTLTGPEDYSTPGNTRFGGRPDLPPTVAHPASETGLLGFYAQLDLEALAPFQDYLPRRGLLSFFVGDEEGLEPTVVLHLTGPRAELAPHDYGEAPAFDYIKAPYAGYRAAAAAGASLPPTHAASPALYGPHAATLDRLGDALFESSRDEDDADDPYTALAIRFGEPARGSGAHVVNALAFAQDEPPEALAATALGGEPHEWIVLLCLDSVPGTDMSFNDAGTLSFAIHESDLGIGDFSRVFASIESS